MAYTTIQISKDTRKRLSYMKQSKRETYDEVINKLLTLIPEGDDEGSYSDDFRISLLNARLDLRDNVVMDHDSIKKQLGL